jgi:hypothetical protein
MRYKAPGFPSKRVIPPPFLFCIKTFQREISLQEKKSRRVVCLIMQPGDLIAIKEKPLHGNLPGKGFPTMQAHPPSGEDAAQNKASRLQGFPSEDCGRGLFFSCTRLPLTFSEGFCA